MDCCGGLLWWIVVSGLVVSGLVYCCVLRHFSIPRPFPPRRTFNCCVLKPIKPCIIRRRPCLIPAGDVIRGIGKALQRQRRLVSLLGLPVTAATIDGGGEGESGPGGRGAESRWLNGVVVMAVLAGGTVLRDAMERFECIAQSALQGVG